MKKDFLLILSSSCLVILLTTLISSNFFGNIASKNKTDNGFGCRCFNLAGNIDNSESLAYFEGKQFSIPSLAYDTSVLPVLGSVSGEKWIEVDLSDQMLWAREGESMFLQTRISSGLPNTPTPQGEFRIWIKLRATKMEGGAGRYYYNLPNVPYVMFFENSQVPGWRGYGLHGTYWHNDFGNPRSHGCVNLPTEIAKQLYYWTTPTLLEGKNVVYSGPDNLGTRIVIHQ